MALTFNLNKAKALTHDYTNYYGVTMTQDEYENLLNLGFDDGEIYYMPEDVYKENKDANSRLITRNQKYYKTIYPAYGNSYTVEVTADEYYHHDNNLRSYVETEYHTIIATIAANGQLYRYKVTMAWNSLPSNKSYDVIAIGFNGLVHINGGTTFYNLYTVSSGQTYYSSSYFDKIYSSTGGSTTYELPSNFVGATAVYFYDIAKDANAGTITSLAMCGDYAHSLSTVTGYQAASHSVDIGGIYFDAGSINYFNEIPCADTYAAVNW